MRIHKDLSGAHMIFPQEQGLALRIYYPSDCTRLDEGEGTDEIEMFAQRFQKALTMFVVNDSSQLGGSFISRVMGLTKSKPSRNRHPPRLFVVTDTAQAIDTLFFFAETIGQKRTSMRSNYYQKVRHDLFLHEADAPPGGPELSTAVSSLHVLAERLNLPEGEVEILLRVFGNLGALFSVQPSQLENVPIDKQSKRLLLELFRGIDGDGLAGKQEESFQALSQPGIASSEAPYGMDVSIFQAKATVPPEQIQLQFPCYNSPMNSTQLEVDGNTVARGQAPVETRAQWVPSQPPPRSWCQLQPEAPPAWSLQQHETPNNAQEPRSYSFANRIPPNSAQHDFPKVISYGQYPNDPRFSRSQEYIRPAGSFTPGFNHQASQFSGYQCAVPLQPTATASYSAAQFVPSIPAPTRLQQQFHPQMPHSDWSHTNKQQGKHPPRDSTSLR